MNARHFLQRERWVSAAHSARNRSNESARLGPGLWDNDARTTHVRTADARGAAPLCRAARRAFWRTGLTGTREA